MPGGDAAVFQVIIQAWDFGPGSNFVLEMQRAATEADRTIMVLSPDYLKSQFASSEWAAALAVYPQGLQRKLLPIVVRQCQPQGLLSAVVHIDLVGEGESEARKLLLDGVSAGRAKPAKRPSFPGPRSQRRRKTFPGQASSGAAVAYVPNLKRKPTDADRRRFSKNAFDVIKTYVQNGLDQLIQRNNNIECDFQANTAAEFTAEVFLSGKSPGIGFVALVDPETTEAQEIAAAERLLPPRGAFIRTYFGAGANVRDVTRMMELLPYDLMIVATHCGDVSGFRWTLPRARWLEKGALRCRPERQREDENRSREHRLLREGTCALPGTCQRLTRWRAGFAVFADLLDTDGDDPASAALRRSESIGRALGDDAFLNAISRRFNRVVTRKRNVHTP